MVIIFIVTLPDSTNRDMFFNGFISGLQSFINGFNYLLIVIILFMILLLIYKILDKRR